MRKQDLIRAALEILKSHGSLQDNIEYTMKSALEGTTIQTHYMGDSYDD